MSDEAFANAVRKTITSASKRLSDAFYSGKFGELQVGDGGSFVNKAFSPLGGVGNDIAKGLGSVDKAVNELPGGWTLPAAVAATVAAPYVAPALTSSLGGAALGADAYMASAGLVPGVFEGAAFTLPSALGAAGVAAEGASSLPSLSWNAPQIGGSTGTGSTFGALNPALPSAGSVGGAGAGMSAALPSGVMIGDGTLGTTIGATYMQAAPGQFAVNALGNAIPASSVGIGGYAPSGTGLTDALKTANEARKVYSAANSLAKLLNGPSGTGGINPQQIASLFGGGAAQTNDYLGQIKMNQNPFFGSNVGTLSGEDIYDVSGTSAMANALRKK